MGTIDTAIQETVGRATKTIMERWGPAGALVVILLFALAVLSYVQSADRAAIAADLKADRERLYSLLEASNKTNALALDQLMELKLTVPRDHVQQLQLAQTTQSEVIALRMSFDRSISELSAAFREMADAMRGLAKNEDGLN